MERLVRIKAATNNSASYQPATDGSVHVRQVETATTAGKRQQQLADRWWSPGSHRRIDRHSIPEGGRDRQISDPWRSGTRKRHPHEACAAQRRALEWTAAWRQRPQGLDWAPPKAARASGYHFRAFQGEARASDMLGRGNARERVVFSLCSRLLANPTWSHHEQSLAVWFGCPGGSGRASNQAASPAGRRPRQIPGRCWNTCVRQ